MYLDNTLKIKELWENNIDEILILQKKVLDSLQNLFKWNELFFSNTKEEFKYLLNAKNNYAIGFYDNKLIAYSVIDKDVSIYEWKTLLPFDFNKSAQIDIVVVSPAYQWKGYWKKILSEIENKYINKHSYIKTLFSTVSPYNKASLKMFLSCWYFIDWLFKKHNKYYRVILRKELSN